MTREADMNRVIAGSFQVQVQLTQHRSIVYSGHVYSDDTPAEVNRRVDEANDVLDRAYIRCDIVSKKAQRENLLAGIAQHRDLLEELRAKRTNGDKRSQLTSQQMQILKQGDDGIRGLEKQIVSLDAAIAAAEKKLKDSASADSA